MSIDLKPQSEELRTFKKVFLEISGEGQRRNTLMSTEEERQANTTWKAKQKKNSSTGFQVI